MATDHTMKDQGTTNDKRKMDFAEIQRAHWAEGYRRALARKPQPMYDSDPDSEDDGLLTPVSLSSSPQNQNQNQNPQTTQQRQQSPLNRRTTPPLRKRRPYACRVTKSMRLYRPFRHAVSSCGSDAVALHPRRKGWVTFRDRGRQISMTFERYLRDHVCIAYTNSFPQLITLAGSSRYLLLTI